MKNADGSTTTRTATGTKTTRPALKRNQGSGSRLATVAANNHAASKLTPLSRSKTSESKTSNGEDDKTGSTSPNGNGGGACAPFISSIYCSQACAQVEQGRSEVIGKDIARTFSQADLHSHHRPSMDGIITNIDIHNHPYAPPSPLFISSDTESSNSLGTATADADSGPASSAPKVMEYFRMSRGGPDDAWNDIQRQRRSSMNPSFRPAEMTRQNTQASSHCTLSSDSLSSMWDSDLYLGRSTSNSGKMRMTPMSHPVEEDRSGPAPIPSRPALPRSTLSHTSLGASSPNDISLLKSYAESFHGKNLLSTSYNNHRGSLVVPSSSTSTALPFDNRRASLNNGIRPSTGTIRAKSNALTWDSLGKQAVQEREQAGRMRRAESVATPSNGLAVPQKSDSDAHHDVTPRQSLKVENGQWKVVSFSESYNGLGKNGTIRSKSRADSRSTQSSHSSAGSSDTPAPAHGRATIRSTSLAAPTTASTLASSPASFMSGSTIPCTTTTPTLLPHARSPGPNWQEYEIKGGKTYEIPKGLKVNTQKAGLFYFH